MNNELAMRTFAYLISNYKKNNETIINLEEIEAIEFLIKENQELKKHMMDLQKELNEENLQCSKYAIENQDLREKLEENSKIGVADHKYSSECEDKVITMKNQQKEFIEYLENEMKKNINWYNYLTPHDKNYYYKDYVDKDTNYMVVLSKYKEIIGGKNDNK